MPDTGSACKNKIVDVRVEIHTLYGAVRPMKNGIYTMVIRYILRNINFSFKEMIHNIPRTLLSSFGIVFLIAFVVFYLSMRQAVKEYIGGKLFGSLQINEIIVSPKGSADENVMFSMTAKQEAISPAKVKKIRQIEGIASIDAILSFDYTTRIRVDVMGRSMRTYVPVFGISREFLKKSDRHWRDFKAGATVPVLVPKYALDLYNNYASARGLPQFGERALAGFPLELNAKGSPMDPDSKSYTFPGTVFGFTAEVPLPGLIVPSDFITKFSSQHKSDRGPGYSHAKLFVKVKNVKDLPEISRSIQKLDLKIESQQDVASRTNRALAILDGSSLFIITVFLLLTVIAIFNSYLTIVYHRSYTFSLQRVVGISKIRIILTFVIEAAIVGVFYGIIGYYMGHVLINYLSANIGNWVPALKGLSFISKPDGLLVMSIGLSALLSSVSALVPSIFASNMNLFKAVQK